MSRCRGPCWSTSGARCGRTPGPSGRKTRRNGSGGCRGRDPGWRGLKPLARRRDFEDWELSDSVAAYVPSLDVGWRKPHPAFFDAAAVAAGHPPDQCAMVGDSEANDIVPAHERGMRTVRVAIEEPLPSTSV